MSKYFFVAVDSEKEGRRGVVATTGGGRVGGEKDRGVQETERGDAAQGTDSETGAEQEGPRDAGTTTGE